MQGKYDIMQKFWAFVESFVEILLYSVDLMPQQSVPILLLYVWLFSHNPDKHVSKWRLPHKKNELMLIYIFKIHASASHEY